MRSRLSIRQQGTLLKCRIQAALRRYGVRDYSDRADLFGAKSRAKLATCMGRLPQETRIATLHEWELLDFLEAQIGALEERIRERIATIGWVRLLKTLSGVGTILGATIYLEIGDVERFPTPGNLASYSGLVPTVQPVAARPGKGPRRLRPITFSSGRLWRRLMSLPRGKSNGLADMPYSSTNV